MCLIIFAVNAHPQYKLVLAANRDEFYSRPDQPAAFWQDNPEVLGGKDLQQGGTWMGVTTTGRFAALTNYRNPAAYNPESPSRGYLVQNYLTSTIDPQSYIEDLDNGGAGYNGFNLLAGSRGNLYYYSNREMLLRKVENGIHGLSNSLLDVPWPKVTRGVKLMTDCLQHNQVEAEQLFAMMADRVQPPDEDLPHTGVSLEMERMLAPLFVTSPDYGTKATTVLLIDQNNQVQFWERTFKTGQSAPANETYYNFQVY